ncbi:MAG: ABC transporter ATP-binding protein [Caldiserica bacterium]|nr:MAG: ABC transporter ATP-binding protein [Caldisericota bacterium]
MEKLKKFVSYYRPHWKLFLLDLISAFIISALDLVFPMATRIYINTLIPNKNIRLIIIFTVSLLILYVIRAGFQYIVDYWGHVLGVRIEYDMRKDLFEHIQTLSFKFFDNVKTGHIMSRIVNDLNNISELAHHGPEDLFISLVMLVGSVIILFTIDWHLTIIIVLFVPIIIWFAMSKRVEMHRAFKNVRKKIASINADIENSISGIRVAKSFTNEEYEIERFDRGNLELKGSKVVAYRSLAKFFTGIYFLMGILNVIVLGSGAYFILKGFLNAGDLVAYLLYVNFFFMPIRRLSNFTQQFEQGMAGFERFLEILKIEPEVKEKENAVELKNVRGDIEFRNVTFSYDNNKYVLSNINLKIPAGKNVAIVGPSGAGKTTLCHLIPRFYDIQNGEILIDGRDIRDYTIRSLRRNIGLVQQDVFLFTGTIKDNIMYGKLDATFPEIVEAAKKAHAHEFIMSFPDGYDTYIGERGVKLSGGQKQRISIARVFLKDPPILILDEATSSLDTQTELLIQEAIKELTKGRTTLIIAHRLSTIKNADEIIVITERGIEERGTHEELLLLNGIYANLYRAQFKDFVIDERID